MKSISTSRAKALIVGDSGVGKTGLVRRLQNGVFELTASTHGASIYQISVPYEPFEADERSAVTRELTLWDLAGQPDYNIVHQIFMQDADVALVVIDESKDAAFDSTEYWVNLLAAECPNLQSKLLVSARVDVGVRPQQTAIYEKARLLGFKGFFRTSAKTGEGINALHTALVHAVDWSVLPVTVMPTRWRSLKHAIHNLAKGSPGLVSVDMIQDRLGDEGQDRNEIGTILQLMHASGEVFVLNAREESELVLLRPEALSGYANSIVLAARTNAEGPGAIDEATVLRADFDLRGDDRLPPGDERLVLDSAVTLLVGTGACYRKEGKLTFPSQRRSEGKCFLSHNWADKPIAEDLARRLLDNGIDVWLDKWEILAGESLTSKIEEAIDRATVFIILMSPNSMNAKWVKEELRIALQRRLEDPKFSVIPLLIEDCEIPGFLRDYVRVDWRVPSDDAFHFLLNSIRGLRTKPHVKSP